MTDDAGRRVFGVGVDRAAFQAGRLEAVVAPHRQVRAVHRRKPAALNLTNTPPVDRRRVGVLFVAGDDAALAADALRHVHMKTVLLALCGRAIGHPSAVARSWLEQSQWAVIGRAVAQRRRGTADPVEQWQI
jgi:D-aminopeptidase